MRRVLSVILKGAVCIALTAPALAFSQDSIEELSRACDSGGGGRETPLVAPFWDTDIEEAKVSDVISTRPTSFSSRHATWGMQGDAITWASRMN
jgi:hypothetical protein